MDISKCFLNFFHNYFSSKLHCPIRQRITRPIFFAGISVPSDDSAPRAGILPVKREDSPLEYFSKTNPKTLAGALQSSEYGASQKLQTDGTARRISESARTFFLQLPQYFSISSPLRRERGGADCTSHNVCRQFYAQTGRAIRNFVPQNERFPCSSATHSGLHKSHKNIN